MAGMRMTLSLKRCQKCERLVFFCLHNLTLSGSLVVNAAKVENTMDNDAVKLLFVGSAYVLGIRTYRVEGDEEVAADFISLRVVKGNDVGVIIVLKELTVDLQDFLIVHKDVSNGATTLAMCLCHGINPSRRCSLVDIGEGKVDAVVSNLRMC